jgi:hypothetical protein
MKPCDTAILARFASPEPGDTSGILQPCHGKARSVAGRAMPQPGAVRSWTARYWLDKRPMLIVNMEKYYEQT